MEWVELALPVGPLAEEVAALLVEISPAFAEGAEVRGEDVVIYSPLDAAPAVAEAIKVAAAHLSASGLPVDPAGLVIRPAPSENEWRDGWKKFFHVRRLGRRLVIVPSWEKETYVPAPSGDDLVLELDPGRAFGTGAHASTRLCLVELERLADAGLPARRLLDVGTGSGILAIVAGKLWPELTGVAVDVDPIAVGAARENLELAGLGARFECSDARANELHQTFDIVVANIQADVLLGLRDALVARIAPGGALMLSGILHDQAAFISDRYVAAGLVLDRRHQLAEDGDRDWMSVVLRKP